MILGEDSSQVSHPPHLTSTWSSAFIPFCAYKTDLNISKNSLALPGLTFPLCSAFLPTVLEGQLCYQLKLNQSSEQGKRNQLMLVLDYNEDRSLQISSEEERVVDFSKVTMNFDDAVQSIQGVSAKVHIGTLSPFTHFGGGIYPMTVVKNMRATDAFLEMPLAQRNCKVELYEDCRTRQLLRECDCVPWEFPGYQVNQSKKPRIGSLYIFSCRPGRYAAQRAGTALSRTRQRLSTAALPVRGCMLTLIGKLQK